jgi:hypothetical protein
VLFGSASKSRVGATATDRRIFSFDTGVRARAWDALVRLIELCNDVGLLSEEFDPRTGRLPGQLLSGLLPCLLGQHGTQPFDELYGIPADIGTFTDAGMIDPDVGRKTFAAVLHREPERGEFARLMQRRLHYLYRTVAEGAARSTTRPPGRRGDRY